MFALSKYFGMSAIIDDDPGSTPELAYRALLRQVAITFTNSGHIACDAEVGSRLGSID
jgi:hypothetical protein